MTTPLQNIFEKPVDRNIEGVIKADADNALATEVQEYVITRELESRLENFLDAYNDYHDANGVWISGFFGSGKSHLLKMLALLLEKHPIEGCEIVDEFLRKANLLNNPLLAGAFQKAVSIPSESILFNIDQKADVISKKQVDALVAVFVKVFDEHCGYYGKQAYIAQFERQLDEDGLLEKFRDAFEKHAGQTWEWGRQRINRVSGQVDTAHQEVTGSSQTGVIEAFRHDYRLSIEDFADHVKQYINRKPRNFRLNFFVDEVGQYIADNTKLMTNLQTIAESLATKCKGQAWILVTAQEDMNTIVGEMDKEQGNDFSKIQARFNERMKLSSQDVAEVIQKRLLKKKKDFEEEVGVIFDHEHNNFKTLLAFSDGAQTYRNFLSREHFIDCYPFIPYQFELFQKAIRALSDQNAFEGRHQSVGERSMLGVFQDVAKQIKEQKLGSLATFDLMYEGLRSALKGQVHAAIGTAEKNLDNQLAIHVLKALFLVKYVREFKPSIHNISVLMLPSFDCNINELRKEVTAALNLLESETYIQRNGNLYEFLTNEEKDVEQEIKNTEIDSKEVADTLHNMLDSIINLRKMRFDENGQDYPYTHKVDDRIFGREQELALHIITPFHSQAEKVDQLKMESMGRKELLAILPPDDRVIRDLQLIKQTERYIKHNFSLTQKDSVRRILADKQATNTKRQEELKQHLRSLLGKSRLFVSGEELEIGSEDVQTRLLSGFARLIKNEYINLKMLQGITYSESQVAPIIRDDHRDLYDTGMAALSEAEQEMFSYLTRETAKGMRSTIDSVVKYFEKAPNGWYLAAIECILAKLCARGKIEARSDGELLSGTRLADAIVKTREHSNVILEPQVEVPASQLRALKNFYLEFFNAPAPSGEAAALGKHVAEKFAALSAELNELLQKSDTFPFLTLLKDTRQRIDQLSKKKPAYFFSDLKDFEDPLLDTKEDLLDPIRQFMGGAMADIYSEASRFLKDQKANLEHLQDPVSEKIIEPLNDTQCFRGNTMQSLKGDLDYLKSTIKERLEKVREHATAEVKDKLQKLKGMDEFAALSDSEKEEIEDQVSRTLVRIDQATLFAVIRDQHRTFEEEAYPQLIYKVTVKKPVDPDPDETNPDPPPPPRTVKNLRQLSVNYAKPCVDDKEDLEIYLSALRTAILDEIEQGHRIQV